MDRNRYKNPEEVRIILKYWFCSRILCCVGLLFLFVTLITPNWIRITSALSRINLGLWSICIENSCRTVAGHSTILDVCRILLSISTLCGLVAVSATLISSPSLSQSKWPLITILTTALISLIAILLFCLSIYDKIKVANDDEKAAFQYAFSFSFIGSCIGCFLFFTSGILFILIKKKESAIIVSASQARLEQRSVSSLAEKDVENSFDRSDSEIGCAYGVM